jgi:hypothetical protein
LLQVTAQDGLVQVNIAHIGIRLEHAGVPAHERNPDRQLERRRAVTRRDVAGLVLIGRVGPLGHVDHGAVAGVGQRILQVPVRRGPRRPVPAEARVVIDVKNGPGLCGR